MVKEAAGGGGQTDPEYLMMSAGPAPPPASRTLTPPTLLILPPNPHTPHSQNTDKDGGRVSQAGNEQTRRITCFLCVPPVCACRELYLLYRSDE